MNKNITIIVGGQYGSEGKGKIAYDYARKNNSRIIFRPGGPNSGHSIVKNGKKIIFRHLSPAILLYNRICIFPAGSYINVNVLLTEIKEHNINPNRIMIDENAVIINDNHFDSNEEKVLGKKISSTIQGVGQALKDRIGRINYFEFAKDNLELYPYVVNKKKIYNLINSNYYGNILIEGTQGYGLSVLHSREYPYVTSRDTTAAGFLSECGLNPIDVKEIIMVLRSYPIRVGGNSGYMKNEISWDEITKRSGYPEKIKEFTSVTNKLRRVAEFNEILVKEAIRANNPTSIVMNHLDYIDYNCIVKNELTIKAQNFIDTIETKIERNIDKATFKPDID
jgi:adenylosuccinate synthase